MRYDLIVVGGGIAGAALAQTLATAGAKVLVLERETTFRDRVRGEQLHCWGAAEARLLGLHELLRTEVGYEVRLWSSRVAGIPAAAPRDLVETSSHRLPVLNFHHPEMQTVMLHAAEAAGAEVLRGPVVLGVTPGERPTVRARVPGGEEQDYEARLIVGADGRNSACRGWAGFEVRRDPERMIVAGALIHGFGAPADRISSIMDPAGGCLSFNAPLSDGRFRSYFAWFDAGNGDGRRRTAGPRSLEAFAESSIAAGAPSDWFASAELIGPLASFEGTDNWVPHPYRNGVALIGDAAASNDPSFGAGLSLALGDVRSLRDQLLANGDWEAAGHEYAAEHDRRYEAVHRITDWIRTLFLDPRPEAAAIRTRALPRIAADPSRRVDYVGLGPLAPSDDAARRRFFGED
ncbi:FAD-binding protein [Roseomonas nepalensis]|uniref:FAD-binding protein n=1 Tax=Muricoccus nepalensis TaxID=1854500 RepID=A0A502F9L1_9PROT|nr:FAD-dependent monooxygenase [Roseomonas nepalensis]TPG46049.1 FAD-binding protein [Roseomonas nepalensis]